ncbi:hypothetical protein QE152_g7252 [Popillia japonica]|uniref:Nuclease HARBI1 n=1 Tax=Popillia japonica TaxID=7064 RepID=A0AAW1MBZ8_POPJA
MHAERFDELLPKVQDCIKKHDTVRRQAIPPKLKLQVTLRYLATGDSFSTPASIFRVPKNTISNFVGEVCTAICNALQDFIKVLTFIKNSSTKFSVRYLLELMKIYYIDDSCESSPHCCLLHDD